MSSQTPIDIHCSKLVSWIIQRRHCKKDWGEKLTLIRRKIRSALSDMPENEEIKQILLQGKLDYFQSKRIVEILQTTEASSKNIFGFYSSQRMKDWKDIVYSYECDCIYLAELCTDLIRETTFEIPSIKRLLNKLKQEKDAAEKERANLLRKSQQFSLEHQRMAQSFGIKGINVGQELGEKLQTLPRVMDEIVSQCKKLSGNVNYYKAYTKPLTRLDASQFLKTLTYVIENGNTSVYEWLHGEKPESIASSKGPVGSSASSNPSEIEIIDDEIDFGDDLPSSESSSGFVHLDKSGSNDEHFIELESPSAGESNMDIARPNDRIARGDEGKLILEFSKSRNQLVSNLSELEAFYSQLEDNLSQPEDKASSWLVPESNPSVVQLDKSELASTLATLRTCLAIFATESNKILFQIGDSPSYLDGIKEKLGNKMKQSSDCLARADIIAETIVELEAQIRDTDRHIKMAIASCKLIKDKVEGSLRALYSGKPINIMGCVG